jgi:hypothetical protein
MERPIEIVLERLKDSDPLVREAAIRELATSNHPAAITTLKDIFENDPDPNLRELAKQTAAQIQQNAKEHGWANAAQSAPPTRSQAQSQPTAKTSPPPNRSGEQVFQMLWDCRFCGTTKLLGLDHRHCPNCGAAQDPEWRYFPSNEDMVFVTNPKYSGVDKVCPFCQQPNSADAKFCRECGGDLSGGKEAIVRRSMSTGFEGAEGIRDDVVKKKFEADLAPALAQKKASGLPIGKIALVAAVLLVIACIAGFFALSNSTYGASLTVVDKRWERVVTIEQLRAVTGDGWRNQVPSGAYNMSCSPRQRAYTESERYVCGFEMVDRGDGSGTRRDKYCTRNKTTYRTEDYCSYAVNQWVFDQKLPISGGPNEPLIWPSYNLNTGSSVGSQREKREEVLIVVFKVTGSDGKTYTLDNLRGSPQVSPQELATWESFRVGQQYNVSINRLEQVQWDSLKLISPQ